MTKIAGVLLSLAVMASVGALVGCEGDESAPRQPRTQLTPLAPDDKAKENAEKRQLEAPAREFPTAGKEFPGQSKTAPADSATVITADARRASKGDASKPIPLNSSDAVFPETHYFHDWYSGPMPHLPENPGSVPMTGTTKVPLSDMTIDNSWGQVMVIKDMPQRDWAVKQTYFMAANGKFNPIYYSNLQDRLPVRQNSGSFGGDWVSNLYEIPWFYAETLILPVYMCVECPFAQVTDQRLGWDPNYFGALPTSGPIVPEPTPGVIKWDYPFLNTSAKDLTTLPANGAIAPTPGVTPAPLGLPEGGPTTLPRREQESGTPGLN